MEKAAAEIKGYTSPVAGDADILVVPNIAAGNILAKSLTCTGEAKTCGVVLGAMVPLVITSRSASVDDKYMSIVLSALIGSARGC
jgi:phosphotransacetylase